MTGLSRSITLSYMIVGHTKLTPDSCFGLDIAEVMRVVRSSAVCNDVELIGQEDGSMMITTYNWCSFLFQH